MAQIDVETIGVPEANDTYTVQWIASNPTDSLPVEIFVYKRSTLEFDHVATVSDLSFPTTPDPTKGFYRSATADANYASITAAEAGKLAVSAAVQSLVDNYTDDFTNDFSGSDGGVTYTPTP